MSEASGLRLSYGRRSLLACFSISFCLLLGGCKKQQQAQAPPPARVEVVSVGAKDVPIVKEWVATLDGNVNAQIRAQVQGYLMRRVYQEGAIVRKGEPLFEIDARPFQAALDQAKGNQQQAAGTVRQAEGLLGQSLAQLAKTEQDLKRYAPLVKTSAISQQEYTDAVQANIGATAAVDAARAQIEATKSAVEAAKATVADAELKLGFTTVRAPIDGLVGLAKAQVGDLVGPTTGDLTTMSTIDPVRCYFTVSEQEYLEYNRAERTPAAERSQRLTFELILADGSVYPEKGAFFAADRQVDVGTGTIRLAALFRNPNNLLRPGQFARIRTVISIQKNALVVPQRAVTELQGSYQIAVVGADNKVSIRPVIVGDRYESMWIVREGIKPGERVIAEGTQKAREGMPVQPAPYQDRPEQKK